MRNREEGERRKRFSKHASTVLECTAEIHFITSIVKTVVQLVHVAYYQLIPTVAHSTHKPTLFQNAHQTDKGKKTTLKSFPSKGP